MGEFVRPIPKLRSLARNFKFQRNFDLYDQLNFDSTIVEFLAPMPKSLLEQLPDIVAQGRKTSRKILERVESRHRVSLQTREWCCRQRRRCHRLDYRQARADRREVFCTGQGSLLATRSQLGHGTGRSPWANRLIYGDNLLAMAALLAGDEHAQPARQGGFDLHRPAV